VIQGVCSRPSGDARGRLVKVRLYSLAGSLMLICLQTRYLQKRGCNISKIDSGSDSPTSIEIWQIFKLVICR
jgi:hypothetical protein